MATQPGLWTQPEASLGPGLSAERCPSRAHGRRRLPAHPPPSLFPSRLRPWALARDVVERMEGGSHLERNQCPDEKGNCSEVIEMEAKLDGQVKQRGSGGRGGVMTQRGSGPQPRPRRALTRGAGGQGLRGHRGAWLATSWVSWRGGHGPDPGDGVVLPEAKEEAKAKGPGWTTRTGLQPHAGAALSLPSAVIAQGSCGARAVGPSADEETEGRLGGASISP